MRADAIKCVCFSQILQHECSANLSVRSWYLDESRHFAQGDNDWEDLPVKEDVPEGFERCKSGAG
jgi:hypothetical protein